MDYFDSSSFWARPNRFLPIFVFRSTSINNERHRTVDRLTPMQANGIRNGLTRNDVIELRNFWHITALTKLKQFGLTAAMLIARNSDDYEFDVHHCYAMINLITKRNFSAQNAINEIYDLTSAQAMGIEEGLTRDDVIELNNFWHISALIELKQFGLTTAMLVLINSYEYEFECHHCYAMINLITKRSFSFQEAITELDGLTSEQAMGIEEGLTRDDVIELSNFWHISVLIELKQFGLTTAMLIARNSDDHNFSSSHCFTLCDLVKNRSYSIQDAFAEIDSLNPSIEHNCLTNENAVQKLITDSILNANDERLENFKCCISAQIMTEPVFSSQSPQYIFEKSKIMLWLAEHSSHPFTRNYLSVSMLVPHDELQQQIQSFILEQQVAEEPSTTSSSKFSRTI